MKPNRQIVDNFLSDLWITCGQLGILHSEKDFLGGAGEGKRRVVHYRGTLSS
jgi:hypothetical protein